MERIKEDSKLPAPCILWPLELKLTHIDYSHVDTLVHFQAQYLTICELDYNILQVEIHNAAKSNVSLKVGDACLVEDAKSCNWFRGRIQNIQNNLFHVFLLDHGNVLVVEPTRLSSISDTLLMLPPKIVSGFFANVLPKHGQWENFAKSYFSSLKGNIVKGYIHARLPHHVLILEVPDITSDLIKKDLGRHVDTSTFLLLVEMLTGQPIPQTNESVPDLLIEKQTGQEYCLKSTSLLGFEQILSLNGPKLKVGQNVSVMVAAAVNSGLFYCRLMSMSKELQEMSEKLAHACESGSDHLSDALLENLGLFCAVKGKDEKWHRGFVECLPLKSQVRVVFIDSGFCESVKPENILQLPSEFLSTPIMAFPCSLSCLEDNDETLKKKQVTALKTGLLGKALDVAIKDFDEDKNLYLVTINSLEKQSRDQAVAKPDERNNIDSKSNTPSNALTKMLTAEVKGTQPSNLTPSEGVHDGSLFDGYVVHVQSPKTFWMRTAKHNSDFEKMMKEMSDYFRTVQLNEEVFEDPVPGALCCAMYEEDMQYYRALIIDTLDKGAEVFFIDFGNTEKVPSILIKKLPRKFAVYPQFAIECALAHVAPTEDIWTTTASEFFRKVTSDKTLIAHIVHRNNNKCVVELFETGSENNSCIAAMMTEAKVALNWNYNPIVMSVEGRRPCDSKASKGNNLPKKNKNKNQNVAFQVPSIVPCSNPIDSKLVLQKDTKEQNLSETPKEQAVRVLKALYFKPGSEVRAICSHLVSPNDFWCQNESTKVELEKLIKDMQEYYQKNTSTHENPGACCAVKYSWDNRWYRAYILQIFSNELLVILVDFGVTILEKMENIKALAPQFYELQEQAFRCCLNSIKPNDGDCWSSEACSWFWEFMSKNSPVTCRIHSQIYQKGKGLCNVISIHSPLQQASSYLIEKGVGVALQTVEQPLSSAYPWSFVYSNFDILPGSEELVHVTSVCNPWEIYVQLERNTVVMERLATKVAEESRLLDAKLDNCKGNMCLAKYFCDGEWYRAQVYPVQSPQHVNVFFVDYGNKQVSEKSNVAAIPKRAVDLLLTPMQALRCSLLNVPESEHLPNVNKWLEMEVLNKSFSARFITCDDNGHFLCDLYDGSLHINEMVKDLMGKSSTAESGPSFSKPAKEPKVDNSKAVLCKANRLDKVKPVVKHKTKPKKTPPKMHKNLQTSKLQIKPCPPKRVPLHQSLPKLDDLPPLGIKPGSRLLGFVSHWNSAKSFFIQMDDDEPKILQMCERLNSTEFKNTKENVANEMKIGDLVAAQYEEDMALYRAVITNVSNSGLLAVEFIDYGNTATVNRSSVYKLTNPFLSHPRLSTPCTHANLDSFGNDECFKEKTADKPLMVEFLQQLQTKWKVSIEFVDDCTQENSKTLNSDEYQTKDVAKCQSQDQMSNVTESQTGSNVQKMVVTKQKDKPAICVPTNVAPSLDQMPNVPQSPSLTGSNVQKMVVSKQKKKWASCVLTRVASTSQHKLPNVPQRTSNTGSNVQKMVVSKQKNKPANRVLTNAKLKKLRKWARKRPNRCKPKVGVKSQFKTSIFKTGVTKNGQENMSKSPRVDVLHVKVAELAHTLDELIVSESHPLPSEAILGLSLETPQPLIQAPLEKKLKYNGFAAAVTTPSEFYVILEDLLMISEAVSSILDDLPEVLAPLPDVHLVPGTSCLVMSEEKKKWCRAEIVDCDLSSVLLNLVDNGQYAVLSRQDACQMKKLPEALIELPKVTYHCLLRGVKPNGPDWSDEAIVFFQNSMCNRSLQIHFGQQVSETQWEVDIIAGTQNLAKELVDLDHAVNIDNNTLGVKFQHEQGSNIESDQEAISWFGTDSTTSEKATEDQHPLEQVALNHLTQSAVLGPTENTKLHLPSGIKQCALM